MMQAGKLRHKITLQEQSITREPQGAETVAWTDFSTAVPAEIIPLTMEETFKAKQVQSEISMRVRIRYISDVDTKMRIVYDDEAYNIESIINPEFRNRDLILLASRVST